MHRHRIQQGNRVRHERSCVATRGGRCDCGPPNEGGRKFQRIIATLIERRERTREREHEVRAGKRRAPSSATLREAWTVWLEGAKAGTIRTRSGDPYKPSALRSYDLGMEARVLPVLEGVKMSRLDLRDFQDLADQLLADGHDPSTIRNTFMGLRALYRRAIARGELAVNPTAGLQLPAVRGRRDRIASVNEGRQVARGAARRGSSAVVDGVLRRSPTRRIDGTRRESRVRHQRRCQHDRGRAILRPGSRPVHQSKESCGNTPRPGDAGTPRSPSSTPEAAGQRYGTSSVALQRGLSTTAP
jgi:hypothetical protein